LVIHLSPEEEEALTAKARARDVSLEEYAHELLRRNLLRAGSAAPAPEGEERRQAADQLMQHLDSMAAKVAPETTQEDLESAIDEALREAGTRRHWAS
jgi:hypothetical protein